MLPGDMKCLQPRRNQHGWKNRCFRCPIWHKNNRYDQSGEAMTAPCSIQESVAVSAKSKLMSYPVFKDGLSIVKWQNIPLRRTADIIPNIPIPIFPLMRLSETYDPSWNKFRLGEDATRISIHPPQTRQLYQTCSDGDQKGLLTNGHVSSIWKGRRRSDLIPFRYVH